MIRRELSRHIAVTLFGGVTGTTSGAGSGTTLVDIQLARYATNRFVGWEIYTETGGNAGEVAPVSGFVGGTGTITVPSSIWTGAPGTSTRYWMVREGSADFIHRIIEDAWAEASNGLWLPYLSQGELLVVAATFDYNIPYRHELALALTGTPTSTVLEDTVNLTQADDYWIGSTFVMTSGGEEGEVRTVLDSDSSSTNITLLEPLSGAPTAAETSTVYKHAPSYLHQIKWLHSDGEYQEIGNQAWEIRRPGNIAQIHFFDKEERGSSLSRVWSQEAKVLQLLGTRKPLHPNSDGDPIEVPDSVMLAWTRYFYHANFARNPAIDAKLHIRQVAMHKQTAEDARDSARRMLPPNSRRAGD